MLNQLISKFVAVAALTLMAGDLGAQVRIGASISFGGPPSLTVSGVVRPVARGHVHSQGYWRSVEERVWVPGTSTRVWVPPTYRTHGHHYGHRHRVLARAGYWTTREHPGHWETQCRRVWVAECGHRC